MSKKMLFFALVLTSLLLSACSLAQIGKQIGQTTVTGSGKLASESRVVSGFDQVELDGIGEVQVQVNDGQEGLQVEAEDNLLKYLKTEVRGSTLVISTQEDIHLRPTKPVRFTVSTQALQGLAIGGSGNIKVDEVQADRLRLGVSGTGNILVKNLQAERLDTIITGSGSVEVGGRAQSQTVELSGSGSYNAYNLENAAAEVTISGSGNAVVWTTDNLKSMISGSGSIHYFGKPNMSQAITGLGRVSGMGSK